jgi:hypothetical protein
MRAVAAAAAAAASGLPGLGYVDMSVASRFGEPCPKGLYGLKKKKRGYTGVFKRLRRNGHLALWGCASVLAQNWVPPNVLE